MTWPIPAPTDLAAALAAIGFDPAVIWPTVRDWLDRRGIEPDWRDRAAWADSDEPQEPVEHFAPDADRDAARAWSD